MPSTKEQILAHLELSEKHINEAERLVESVVPPDPPQQAIEVHPGDSLMQKINDNPAGSVFAIATDFVDDLGVAELPKPCTLISKGARLIAILYVQHDTHFIGLNIDGANQNTIITAADNFTLDKCTLTGNAGGQHRGVLVNAKGVRIRNSNILSIFRDIDTQAIAGWDRTNDLEIIGCELEASGENILFGGDSSSSEANIPRNIYIKGNYLSKQLDWQRGARRVRGKSSVVCKNLIEVKNGRDIIIEENVLDYSFVDGQIGYAVVMTVRNEYGNTPWATIANILFDNNLIRHVAGGFQILGRDDRPGYASQVMTNVTIRNTIVEDMSWEYGGNGKQFFISGGPDHLTIEGNEFTCPTKPNSALNFDQPHHLCTHLVVKNNKRLIEGEYGIFGTSAPGLGTPVLEMYAPGYVWENNKVQKSDNPYAINWPPGTIFI